MARPSGHRNAGAIDKFVEEPHMRSPMILTMVANSGGVAYRSEGIGREKKVAVRENRKK